MFSFERGTFLGEVWIARFSLMNAMATTVELSFYIIVSGTLLGALLGVVLVYAAWPFRLLVRVYVDVMRGIPVLVLIFFWFFGLAFFKIHVSAFWSGVMAIGAFCAAHMAETVRGAIQSIPQGQTEAAKAIGMTFVPRLWYVILPQAARRVVPPWVNTAVEMVKATTLLSIIGVVELLLATQQAVARNYMIIEFYLAAAFCFFVINFTLSQIGAYLERRFAYMRY